MRGTKPSLATCATFCESLTPSNRRTATYMALAYLLHIEGGPRRPCRVDQRAQCERLQGLAQLPRIPIPPTSVNGAAKAHSSSRPDSRMAALFFLSFRAGSGCNHSETCAGCVVAQGVQVCLVAQLGREGL